MTFYEAALRVLEAVGHPLHVLEITEKSIAQNLLSHVGKAPDQTMLSRLSAMARRTRDRRLIVTAKDTFALADWALPEDPDALAQTGVPEPNPEESLPPLRAPERHPEARSDNVRATGRGERKRRYEEEDEVARARKRRFPPIAEVTFEILSEAGDPLKPAEIAERARERELASGELNPEQILTALLEDNQRRIDVGRRPQFTLSKETGQVALERAGEGLELPPQDVQSAFASALGIALEGGRPVLAKGPPSPSAEVVESAIAAARASIRDARRAVARDLRRKLAELDVETFEKAVVKALQGLGFRELKVAKRSKDGPLLTARKRDGSIELRFAIRMLRAGAAVDRRSVQELRRDLGHYAAQLGLLVSAGDLRGDARGEAQAGGPLVLLWCGDGLGEKFLEARAGVNALPVELFEVDEKFFATARVDAEESRRRRQERLRDRQSREPARKAEGGQEIPEPGKLEVVSSRAEPSVPSEPSSTELSGSSTEPSEAEIEAEGEEVESDQDAAEGGGEPEVAAVAQPGDRKRRRRRRRGRRGRGRSPEAGGAKLPGAETATATPSTTGGEPVATGSGGSPEPVAAPSNGSSEPTAPPASERGEGEPQ